MRGGVASVVFVHGKDRSPSDIWYPWFGDQVRAAGMTFKAPSLTTGSTPVLAEWLAGIDATEPDEHTVLVGHSRGGMAVLRWLEQAPKGVKVAKVILLATNRGDDPDKAGGDFFYAGDYNFKKIKQHCDDFVVFHSRDDEWVPFEAGEHNAEGLGAKFVVFDRKGHLGSTLATFPELVQEIIS